MPWMGQATYSQGAEIVVDVALTAVHMGHFVFSGCPLMQVDEVPTQECFDKYKLTFVEDFVYGANADPNFPERVYVSPINVPTIEGYVTDTTSSTAVMNLSFRMTLPPDLIGDHVLLQWYYLTANSCYHEGYLEYDWPDGWATPASSRCDDVSSDGDGTPEQFWNCAEVQILPGDAIGVDAPAATATSIEVPAPAPTVDTPAPIATATEVDITPASVPSQGEGDYPPFNGGVGSHGKTIVGYYASWQWYDRSNKASPEAMDFTKLQRVNFAFFQTDTQGAIWGTDSWADPIVLFGPYNWNPTEESKEYCSWDGPGTKNCNNHEYEKGLIHLAHAAGAEVYPSLGGWTLSDAFPAMAADATARATFAQNCVNLIMEYNFDGIDIDWEYPGYVDHSGTPQDTDNFRLLLDDVRASLDSLGSQTGRFYGLTAALPCGPSNIANMDIAHVAKTLTQLNLMTYDFHGSFSETTGTNAPLYDQGWGEEDFDVHNCVKNWIKGGATRDKINIGLPFYGRSFATATGLNEPHTGADQTHWLIDDGTPQYFNIITQLPSMTSVWDEKTFTPYAYFADGGIISYDNENAICAKVQYVQEHELAGFIIWELSGDVMDDLSTPLLDITNKKLNNPDLSCGEPGILPEDGGELPKTPASSPIASYESSVPVQPSTSTANQSAPSSEASDSGQLPTMPDTSAVGEPASSIEASAVGRPSNVFACGSDKITSNIANAKSLDISFWYELHCDSIVPESNCLKEVKSSMLTSIANELQCTSSSHLLRRGLSSDQFAASKEYVRAIESANKDVPQDVSCSVMIDPLDLSTNCFSVIGRLTAKFDVETPDEVLNEVRDEILSSIRINMALGVYESAKIKKVIYGDLVKSNIYLPNYTNSVMASQARSGGGSKSTMIMAVLFSMFVIVLLGVLLFVFRKRRGPQTKLSAEVHIGDIDATESVDANRTWSQALEKYEFNHNNLVDDSVKLSDHDVIHNESALRAESIQHIESEQKTNMNLKRFMRQNTDPTNAADEINNDDDDDGMSGITGAVCVPEGNDNINDNDVALEREVHLMTTSERSPSAKTPTCVLKKAS